MTSTSCATLREKASLPLYNEAMSVEQKRRATFKFSKSENYEEYVITGFYTAGVNTMECYSCGFRTTLNKTNPLPLGFHWCLSYISRSAKEALGGYYQGKTDTQIYGTLPMCGELKIGVVEPLFNSQMSSYDVRLSTFGNTKHDKREELATIGFYLSPNKVLCCFRCGFQLHDTKWFSDTHFPLQYHWIIRYMSSDAKRVLGTGWEDDSLNAGPAHVLEHTRENAVNDKDAAWSRCKAKRNHFDSMLLAVLHDDLEGFLGCEKDGAAATDTTDRGLTPETLAHLLPSDNIKRYIQNKNNFDKIKELCDPMRKLLDDPALCDLQKEPDTFKQIYANKIRELIARARQALLEIGSSPITQPSESPEE